MKKLSLILFFFIGSCSCLLAQDLNKGLVHYYSFDGHVKDSTFRANHLTNNGATLTADRFGNANSAYHFENAQYMTGSYDSLPAGKEERSVSLWLYMDVEPDSDVPFCWGSTANSGGYGVAIGDNVGFDKGIRHFGWGNDVGFAFNYNVKTWFHILTTYDGDTAKMYIDGNLVSKDDRVWNTGKQQFLVGRNLNDNPRDEFVGSLDEFRIYDRILTSAEIDMLANESNVSSPEYNLPKVTLYPNPVSNSLQIDGLSEYEIEIFNSVGQQVLSANGTETSLIDVSDLTTGMFSLVLTDLQTGLQAQRKFIKVNPTD